MQGYTVETMLAACGRSRDLFELVVSFVQSEESSALTHAELEDQLEARSRELFRQLYQDHLDLRAVREVRREHVVDAEQIVHARVEPGHSRGLVTVFGQVRVQRLAYRAPGACNLYPADAALNLPRVLHSHGLQRLAAVEAARGSFADAVAAIARATAVGIGKRQLEQLACAAAVDVEGFYESRKPPVGAACDGLVLTCDGKGIVMRPDALREATAKAAASAGRKLSTRLSKGEKANRKRMAEVVCVYDFAPRARTPAQVTAGPDGKRRRCPGPVAAGKWLHASVEHDTADMIAAMFDEADRRDPDRARTWVALVDGNNHQLERITAEAATRQVKITIIVDFIHVVEYLWQAAWCFHAQGDPAAEAWVADQIDKILTGRSQYVAGLIRRTATTLGLARDKRSRADETATYLINKRPYLDYARALKQGWPIATGVIEGACRYLIADRLDITGARWGLAGAEAILKLRALIANGDFEAYWPYHLKQERNRNHDNRYHDSVSPR